MDYAIDTVIDPPIKTQTLKYLGSIAPIDEANKEYDINHIQGGGILYRHSENNNGNRFPWLRIMEKEVKGVSPRCFTQAMLDAHPPPC